MSHLIPLGQLAAPDAARDAIHLAICPVIAAVTLKPGTHVQVDPATGRAAPGTDPIGIIDPFLKRAVKAGERTFLLLYPNTITSLRHAWSHPKLPEQMPAAVAPIANVDAINRIQAAADNAGIEYDEMIEAAKGFLDHGTYLCEGGRWEGGGYLPDTFWDDFQLVTGREVPADQRWSFFSCSC